MFPQKIEYPQFVPDQLLTSEHLNQLFEYLEEQGRLTRTNLIGIGIYCGGEIKTAEDGASITITKLCGVTSEGYLISMPEVTYTRYKAFNAVKDRYYDRFVDIAAKQQRYTLYELTQDAVEEATFPLSMEFLKGQGIDDEKVVLVFVELLEEGNKNCNPNSCDDKGVNVTVSFRPLLIGRTNASKLITAGLEDPTAPKSGDYFDLPEWRIKRWNVPAASILDTADVFIAYRQILNKTFITKTENVFSSVYDLLKPLIIDQYPVNPFLGMALQFELLYKNTIETDELVQLQYYYDLFSDLLLAYDELRIKGMEMISQCCPAGSLFPRHLLLGEAVSTSSDPSDYRSYFIPSPALCCDQRHLLSGVKELFKRLVLMINQFFVPPVPKIVKGTDEAIRITPSKHDDRALSGKSIPFYYKVKNDPDPLYRYWSMEQNARRSPNRILSYHAALYNNTDESVTQPLLYDLEPYNFLRIEGHVGKPYVHVLKNITQLKDKYRLPIEVIALSADVRGLGNADDLENSKCYFQDLGSVYDSLIAELKCSLCGQMKYYYGLRTNVTLPYPSDRTPSTSLLRSCDPGFLFTPNTIGHEFEIFYAPIKNLTTYIRPQQFFSANTIGGASMVALPAPNINETIRHALVVLIYYIEELSKTLAKDLDIFNLDTFTMRFEDLQLTAGYVRSLLRINVDTYFNAIEKEDIIDHTDELSGACKVSLFESLVTDYLNRLHYANLLRKFGYFIKKHPGVQHKAGVPMGGTFIIVYHEKGDDTPRPTIETPPIFIPPIFANSLAGPAFANRITADVSAAVEETALPRTPRPTGVSIQMDEVEKEFDKVLKSKLPDLFLEGLIADIPDGTVIADFYLPYIFSSDCPPIQYILNEVTEKLSLGLPGNSFCKQDEGTYNFTISPPGGEVTVGEEGGDSVQRDESGNFTFSPILVPMEDGAASKELTFVYTKDGNSVVLTATVYRQPQVSFVYAPGRPAGLDIQFTAMTDAGSEFLWSFGDNGSSTAKNPLHTYGAYGTYQVSLQVTNGACSQIFTQDIQVQQVAVALLPGSFCAVDEASYPFIVSPLGGQITSPPEGGNNGVTVTQDGTIVFVPAAAALTNEIAKRVLTFTYTVPGQSNVATTQATVYRQPSAAFETAVENNPVTFKFSNFSSEFADAFKWDFGDGETSNEKDPVHTYKTTDNKDYTVILTVSNGPCQSSTSQIVSVIVAKEKVCLPLTELLTRFFRDFDGAKTQPYVTFKNDFTQYAAVVNFFRLLGAADTVSNPDKQMDLFRNIKIGTALSNWLEQLFGLLAGYQDPSGPLPGPIPRPDIAAIALLRILTDLAMYISCLQPDDIDKDFDPPLKSVFDMIAARLPQVKRGIILSSENVPTLQLLKATFKVELQRLVDNEEDKPLYKAALNKLIQVMTSIGIA